MITATFDQAGEVLSLTIGNGQRYRTYSATELLEALAKADRLTRRITHQNEAMPYRAIEDILISTAELFRMPIRVIIGSGRSRSVCLARFAAARAARRAGHTWDAIGMALGGRDHTTIMYAEQRAADLEQTDRIFAAQMAALMQEVA